MKVNGLFEPGAYIIRILHDLENGIVDGNTTPQEVVQ